MKVKHHAVTHPLALFPASMLKDGQRRQRMAVQVPRYEYVLVARRGNSKQTQLMRRLGHSLQLRGIRVSVLML